VTKIALLNNIPARKKKVGKHRQDAMPAAPGKKKGIKGGGCKKSFDIAEKERIIKRERDAQRTSD